jgi:hypothetical protein
VDEADKAISTLPISKNTAKSAAGKWDLCRSRPV